ncbi:MAG: cobyrinate a,c-diamide synthase [Methanomassiliicoccaceae archaeon]|nr:cobyrinate a,c-diamide synthase [Methanomassiliicoccaceae archaeon]
MKIPRIMIAAVSSGSGKTLITCGILQALVNRKLNVTSFKCGPDYIDPMFHEKAIGTRTRNLDMFFTDAETTRYLFSRMAKDSDISVIEGVMGFYDGMGGRSTDASSYDLSSKLDVPVVLVIDCKGASVSVAAMIKGFAEFRKNNIRAVILNNMHEKIYHPIKEMIESELKLKVIGYVPNVKELVIESRHLGLLLPDEVEGLKDKLNGLALLLERTVNIDSLVQIANSAPGLVCNDLNIRYDAVRTKIGVASDECFCFIYKDNIELLERQGAEIVYFSPLNDERIPEDVSGMIIPGGYPELFADKLSGNVSMLADIKERIKKGMPCMAEGGGFLYLHNRLEDNSGVFRNMAGAIGGDAFRTGKLSKFGYVTITTEKDGILNKNSKIRGHEFHYWDSTACGDDCEAVKTLGARHKCMHMNDNIAAGFPHLYYYSDPGVVHNFLIKCAEYHEKGRGSR